MKTLEQYHLPSLPEGFKKKYWIDSFGNTVCVIYEKDNRSNVVSVGVAWLNESDKLVKDRVIGKAISYGRAFKHWKDKPVKKPTVYTASFSINGVQIPPSGTMTISGYNPKIGKITK
jgi:hypothetical protein